MPHRQRERIALSAEQQLIVVGVAQQPAEAESLMLDAPDRQTHILSGIEYPLTHQKRLPHRIAARHIMALGQGPDQALAHGIAGLAQELKFSRGACGDREVQVTLIEINAD
ncbi:hypothetical protein PS681_05153 [Pseudomonas fluorescens]|nr:hypothetical protein PS681_05153 [Pseudomonas fluorescens]